MIADPKGAAAMGRAGLDRVRLFTASAVVARIDDLYQRVLARAGGPPRQSSETLPR